MHLAHYSYCHPISSVGQVSLLPDPANLNAPYLPLEPAPYSRSVQNRIHETPRCQRIADQMHVVDLLLHSLVEGVCRLPPIC